MAAVSKLSADIAAELVALVADVVPAVEAVDAALRAGAAALGAIFALTETDADSAGITAVSPADDFGTGSFSLVVDPDSAGLAFRSNNNPPDFPEFSFSDSTYNIEISGIITSKCLANARFQSYGRFN